MSLEDEDKMCYRSHTSTQGQSSDTKQKTKNVTFNENATHNNLISHGYQSSNFPTFTKRGNLKHHFKINDNNMTSDPYSVNKNSGRSNTPKILIKGPKRVKSKDVSRLRFTETKKKSRSKLKPKTEITKKSGKWIKKKKVKKTDQFDIDDLDTLQEQLQSSNKEVISIYGSGNENVNSFGFVI